MGGRNSHERKKKRRKPKRGERKRKRKRSRKGSRSKKKKRKTLTFPVLRSLIPPGNPTQPPLPGRESEPMVEVIDDGNI